MRFLILTVVLAFTASPALGQFRPELPQWAEQGSALDQNRFGLMYDLDWDVPQNDAEGMRWKPILIGAGIGLTLGYVIGWMADGANAVAFPWLADDMELNCLPPTPVAPGSCTATAREKTFRGRITGSLVGTGVGTAIGWLWRPLGGVASD